MIHDIKQRWASREPSSAATTAFAHLVAFSTSPLASPGVLPTHQVTASWEVTGTIGLRLTSLHRNLRGAWTGTLGVVMTASIVRLYSSLYMERIKSERSTLTSPTASPTTLSRVGASCVDT